MKRNELSIRLLGSPLATRGGQPVAYASRRGWLLLAYLAVQGSAGRSALAGLLWPDREPADARGRLRRCLSELQSRLGRGLVHAGRDSLQLTPEAAAGIDLCRLRAWLAARRQGEMPDSAQIDALASAASLELLQGIDCDDLPALRDDWLRPQRELCRQLLLHAVTERMKDADGHGAVALPALASLRLQLDPFDEGALRRLMRNQAARREHGAALQTFQAFRERLSAELGLQPGAETRALAQRIEEERWRERVDAGAGVRYVRNGEVHIAYRVLGANASERTLLVLPGLVTHMEVAFEAGGPREMLDRLAGDARVVVFDRRGIGLSDRLGHTPDLASSLSDMLAVLDAVGAQRVDLAGFSEGGPIAIAFAARHPQRVRSLFLCGTMARGAWAPDYPHALRDAQYDLWLEKFIAHWGGPTNLAIFAPHHVGDETLARWWGRMLRSGATPSSMRLVLRALRDMDVRADLQHVRCATVVAHREGDLAVPLAAGRYLAERIPSARWLPLPGDEHWWWLGQTEPLLSAMSELVTQA